MIHEEEGINLKIQVYASECTRCQIFLRNLQKAVEELNLDVKIEKINAKSARSLGIKSSPSIIINDEIKSYGEILSVDELKKLLQ